MESIRKALDAHVRRLLTPAADLLARAGVSPDQVTVAGFALSAAAAALLAAGHSVSAGVVFLLGSGLDLLDGLLARCSNRVTRGGAFLDSTLDRVSEGLLFAAIAYRYALAGEPVLVALTVVALLGSLLVSYTRARAEGLGVPCAVGVMGRPERVVVLGAALVLSAVDIAIYVIVILSLFTSVQRIVHARRSLQTGEPPLKDRRPG
jgi:CDP-diacylglycerol--glycerol-3-phosphate 3-phosphatidyltransferase